MKVASKIVLVACVAFLPAFAIHTWLSLEREEALFRSDMERDLSLLGSHLSRMARDEWSRGGADAIATLLAAAGGVDDQISISWHAHRPGESPPRPGLQGNGDGRLLVWVEPVQREGRSLGAITLSESLEPMDRYLEGTLLRLAILSTVLAVAALLAARALSHRLIGRRLGALAVFAADTGAGEFGREVDVGGRDEITELAASLGTMSERLSEARRAAEQSNAERLSMLQQLRHADRLATMGRLAGSVAHELGTPLNVVMGHANRITEGAQSPADTKESASTIHRQVKRMEGTIRDILGFVRKTPEVDADVDLAGVAGTVQSLLRPLAKQRRIDVEVDPAHKPMIVRGREVRLEQAVSNLVTNAIDASPDGGRVALSLAREQRSPRAGGAPKAVVVLRVHDEGEGVPESLRERLFEPFYTSKPPGEGTGLGLWLADGIVRDHGGSIEVETPRERGACFAIVIPAAEED